MDATTEQLIAKYSPIVAEQLVKNAGFAAQIAGATQSKLWEVIKRIAEELLRYEGIKLAHDQLVEFIKGVYQWIKDHWDEVLDWIKPF